MSDKKAKYYSLDQEATVPTPPDQEDVNALDMVSGAVEEMMDTFQQDVGLGEPPQTEDSQQQGGQKQAGQKQSGGQQKGQGGGRGNGSAPDKSKDGAAKSR